MHAVFESISSLLQDPRFAAAWFDALLKSFVVLGFAGGVSLMWRRAASATRHLIWFLALVSLPLLPLLPHVLPTAHRPIWSVSSELVSGNQISLSLELEPTKSPSLNIAEPSSLQNSAAPPETKSIKRVINARFGQNWLAIAFGAWAVGMVLLMLYSTLGRVQLRKISRHARPLKTPEWTRLLVETCTALRLRRRVVLLQSGENIMPVTWGWLRAKVLMPLEAEHWTEDRRRIVLMHELAHVKRLDCFTQTIARIVAALYWFNPLAWVAARQMCIERERACDDLVINGGCKASDYAGHLVQIAKAFRRAPQMAGIAMARSSNLEERVTAIVDPSRARQLRPIGLIAVLIATATVIFSIGGYETTFANDGDSSLHQQQIKQLEDISRQKLEHSKTLAASSGGPIPSEFQRFFDAAIAGDFQTVSNMYEGFRHHQGQYDTSKGHIDVRLWSPAWEDVLDICLAYYHVVNCNPKYIQIYVDGIINSIPPGSIYIGGTDPGRGLPTAFSKSHVNADPFYIFTQNAFANPLYLEYLQDTYGERRHWLGVLAELHQTNPELQNLDRKFQSAVETAVSLMNQYPESDSRYQDAENKVEELRKEKREEADKLLAKAQAEMDPQKKAQLLSEPPQSIYIATAEDSQKAFDDYSADAARRLEHDEKFPKEPRQIKPGEDVTKGEDGKIKVSGEIAVMSINGLLAKDIFDRNPDHEFYLEESFPLDWMFPHLEPHGLIMKINREPLAKLPEDVVQRDHGYWQKLVGGMIGDWLTDDTSVKTVTEFAERVFLRKDLKGFTGDPQFLQDSESQKMFSKLRSSIGGVYSWRLGQPPSGGFMPAQYVAKDKTEKARMEKEADFAFKQSFAICPYSPEAVYRYVQILVNQKRLPDALLIAQTASHLDPANGQFTYLVRTLKQMH